MNPCFSWKKAPRKVTHTRMLWENPCRNSLTSWSGARKRWYPPTSDSTSAPTLSQLTTLNLSVLLASKVTTSFAWSSTAWFRRPFPSLKERPFKGWDFRWKPGWVARGRSHFHSSKWAPSKAEITTSEPLWRQKESQDSTTTYYQSFKGKSSYKPIGLQNQSPLTSHTMVLIHDSNMWVLNTSFLWFHHY